MKVFQILQTYESVRCCRISTIMDKIYVENGQYISKKTCFPSTRRKVLDFDLNGQHMRKTEVPEGNWILGCSPDHSTIAKSE